MKLTAALAIGNNHGFWYRINGYWRSFGFMRAMNLWSDRKEQQYKSYLMAQHGKGKSRAKTIYEIVREPKYNIKWVRSGESGVMTTDAIKTTTTATVKPQAMMKTVSKHNKKQPLQK